MAKLDRLGWAAGLSFTSHGVRIGIRVTAPDALEVLSARLPPGSKPAQSPVVSSLYSLVWGGGATNSSVRRFHVLYVGSARLARTMDQEEVLEKLESALHFEVAYSAKRRLFVHAGVVAWRGRAIVIPGASRSGKSSLVAALVSAGATYYSDEYAPFDIHGRVYPYAKPLSLRGTNGESVKKVTADALGGCVGVDPLPVGTVVVTEYRSGARWRLRRLSPAEGMLALLANTVLARIQPALALKTLRHVVDHALIVKGKRGEAAQVAASLLDSVPTHTAEAIPITKKRARGQPGFARVMRHPPATAAI